jgi:hypothetical protein
MAAHVVKLKKPPAIDGVLVGPAWQPDRFGFLVFD